MKPVLADLPRVVALEDVCCIGILSQGRLVQTSGPWHLLQPCLEWAVTRCTDDSFLSFSLDWNGFPLLHVTPTILSSTTPIPRWSL
jgi:hypothetical protein